MLSEQNFYKILEQVGNIARMAGLEIMKIYTEFNNVCLQTYVKSDQSPVTNADLCSHKIIIRLLHDLTPNIPIISEEDLPEWEICKKWEYFWVVDPLDGTKEFLSRNGEFTVNIAFIKHGEPLIGVIYVPAFDILYLANNYHAWKIKSNGEKLQISVRSSLNPTVVISRNHLISDHQKLYNYLINIKNYKIINIGSSLKFCLIAEGVAQFYPRFSNTKIWDTAAGHIIAKSAGALIKDWNGCLLNYKFLNRLFLNPGFQVSLF